MALGKHRDNLKEVIEKYRKIIEEDSRMLSSQNKEIVRLKEELKQAQQLIGLYEACIQQGIQIDFPNSEKGGNADNTGDIDFSDF